MPIQTRSRHAQELRAASEFVDTVKQAFEPMLEELEQLVSDRATTVHVYGAGSDQHKQLEATIKSKKNLIGGGDLALSLAVKAVQDLGVFASL